MKLTLRIGALRVRLPGQPDAPLWLVVVRGLGQEPILLLTHVGPTLRHEHAVHIAHVYLTRWKIEETYRFLKQTYPLEDVRVRSYVALRNVYVLLMAVMFFVGAVLGARSKLHLIFTKLCEKAQCFFHVPSFFHYALADGIHRILFGSRPGFEPTPAQHSRQLSFAFARPPNT